MKVAVINIVFGEKSTGRTYAELKSFLENNGHECRVYYGAGYSKEKNAYRIGNKFSYYFHNIMSRVTGLEGYFSYFATKKLIRRLKEYDPDVVHLGNIHGHFLNLPLIFKYLKKYQKKVVLTTHDCWIFTGKCSHFIGFNCGKWMTGCKNCSSKKDYPKSYFFDFSKKMYKDKKKWLLGLKDLSVIAVSEWMGEQVKKSFLKDKQLYVNYNWIDTTNFKPLSQEERNSIRQELGYSEDDFVIVAVSTQWKKGTPRYEDLNKLSQMIDGNQKLLSIGIEESELVKNERRKHIPFVSDVKYLAKLYGSADAFVHFSTADTFGKVIAEAQATGTPAIVYDRTACPEVARLGNGYVVQARNVEQAHEKIKELSQLSKSERDAQRQDRAKRVASVLSKDVRVNKYLEIYLETFKDKE